MSAASSLNAKVPTNSFSVSEFKLMGSKLTQKGPVHKVCAVFPLQPGVGQNCAILASKDCATGT